MTEREKRSTRSEWHASPTFLSTLLVLAELVRRARELGCHSMLARITSGNLPSIRLHERQLPL